jgi:hypothetical protein
MTSMLHRFSGAIVYTESMSDAEGNLIAPSDLGMPADRPTTTELVVELTDAGGRTKMVMTHIGIPADSLWGARSRAWVADQR